MLCGVEMLSVLLLVTPPAALNTPFSLCMLLHSFLSLPHWLSLCFFGQCLLSLPSKLGSIQVLSAFILLFPNLYLTSSRASSCLWQVNVALTPHQRSIRLQPMEIITENHNWIKCRNQQLMGIPGSLDTSTT